MIFDQVQSKNFKGHNHTHADALHAKEVVNLIVGISSEHAACYLAIRYGLARAMAGHVSIQKLAKVTRLPQSKCRDIINDIKRVVVGCGGIA